MDSKIKSKIQKLLALAQSDNPHEALRARTQAEALMRKHNLTESDTRIVDKPSIKVYRKSLKSSEAALANTISRMTGTFSYANTRRVLKHDGNHYTSTIHFVGDEHSAEIAAYSLEVLFRQMEKAVKAFREANPGLKFSQVERFMEAYAIRASEKVINIMGERPLSEDAKKWKESEEGNMKNHEAKKSKPQGAIDNAIVREGLRAGAQAQLHVATNDNRTKYAALPASV